MNIGSGTGTCFEVPLSEPHLDYKDRIDCCCHIFPDAWEYELGLLTGACLRWFRDNFGYQEVEKAKLENGDPYHYLDELAEKVNEGSDMLFCYPFFSGASSPRFDFQAKAVYFGFTLWHGKPHFVRSLLEGIAFQYVGIIELLNELGVRVKDASMTGGETKSRIWNQIKADVIGMNIRVPVVEDASAALGSAILAGIGSGVYKNVQDGVKRCIRFKDVYRPRSEHNDNYARIYEKYKKAYESISKAYSIFSK
jgi:xylulokinase